MEPFHIKTRYTYSTYISNCILKAHISPTHETRCNKQTCNNIPEEGYGPSAKFSLHQECRSGIKPTDTMCGSDKSGECSSLLKDTKQIPQHFCLKDNGNAIRLILLWRFSKIYTKTTPIIFYGGTEPFQKYETNAH